VGDFQFGDVFWLQAAETPTICVFAEFASGVRIKGVINDSTPAAVFGAFGYTISVVDLTGNGESGQQFTSVTGTRVSGLTIEGQLNFPNAFPTIDNTVELYGTANTGGINFLNPPSTWISTAASAVSQARPLILTQPYGCVFVPVPQVVCTASASGSGTWAAGNHTVQCTSVGWDGGESVTDPYDTTGATTVTTNGSQGIAVSWTPVPGMAAVNVYIDTELANSTPLTGTSQTFTGTSNGISGPSLDGTGLPFIGKSLIITPKLILPVATTPASASAPGTPGQFAWDSSYLYICVALNTWQRVATSTWS
jgi:hypothetical protein